MLDWLLNARPTLEVIVMLTDLERFHLTNLGLAFTSLNALDLLDNIFWRMGAGYGSL
jgi:hypothetical protein